MKTHTLTVRDRRLSWDDRTLVRGSVAADRVEVALDDEYKACDTVHAVMVSAAHPQPVRMAVEGSAYSIPSELTLETGSILTCLIGYVGDVQRVISEQESQPLVVAKSGPVGGSDPQDEQPDLWAQLIATVESAERIAQSVRDDADAGRFDGADGKTPVRGVDYWTPEDRKPIEDATLAATTAASRADAAAATATEGEEVREAAETARADAEAARAEAELTRGAAETGRVEAEATRAANESKRTETFNANLTSWNGKVDAACKKATDTASKAAQDAKTATSAAIAKTEEATNAAVAKAQTATDNATMAANKAEAAVAQLPLPLGNTLKGEAEATLVNVDDAYPAPLVTTKVLGQSDQQQEPAPSHENPQEITSLNKVELVVTGKNLADVNESNNVDFTLRREPLPAGTYTFSCDKRRDSGFFFNVKKLDDSGTVTQEIVTSRTSPCTFTISEPTALFINGWGLNSPYVIGSIQLEAGSTATAYEPRRQSENTAIDLKGNELCSVTENRVYDPNTFRDELVIDSEGNVSLIKRVFSAHIDGLEPMSLGVVSKYQYFSYTPKTVHPIDGSFAICSNRFSTIGREPWNFYVAGGSNTALFFAFPLDTFANDSELNEWLKRNPIDVNYLGAEFQTIPLGKVELPALPEATSNIWNNGNIRTDVDIIYVRDINIVIGRLDDKLAKVSYNAV